MEDTEPLEYAAYQALWRTKHNGEDALAFKWPAAPILVYLYRCTSAAEFDEVRELYVQAMPAEHTTAVGWFYTMDREQVRHVCTSEAPPAEAESADDWICGVHSRLVQNKIVFWEGDSEADLVSFGALDEQSVSEPDVSEPEGGDFVIAEAEYDETTGGETIDSEAAMSEHETSEPIFSEPDISEPTISEPDMGESAPASETDENKDDVTYDSGIDSGLDDMEIDWFDTSYIEPEVD